MKKVTLFITISCSLFTIHCFSQAPNWLWGRDAICSPNGGGLAFAIAKDGAGNIYHTGIFGDTITYGSNSYYDTDTGFSATYIAKYDSSGNILWARSSGGPGAAIVSAITVDGAANVYITGYYLGGSVSFGPYTLDTTDYDGIFMAKYDSSGNVLWAVICDSSSIGYPYGITTDLANNVYLTGTIYSPTIKFGNHILNNNGLVNLFIVKYDSAAHVIWAKKAGETGIDKTYGITSDTLGNEYVTGYFNSPQIVFGNDTLHNLGNHNVFIAKYDSSGNALWGRSGGGIYGEMGLTIASDKNNSEYIAGFFTSPTVTFGTDTLTSPGGETMFLAKYDAAGNIRWLTSSANGFNCNCFPYDVAVDQHSNPVVIGLLGYPMIGQVTFDTTILNPPPDSHNPMYIVKYDSAGHSLWGKIVILGGGDDNTNGGVICDSNNIYICAEFETNPLVFRNDSLYNYGIHSPFLAKLGHLDNVGIPEIEQHNSVSIFPNPNDGNFTIYNMGFTNYDLQITDLSGREVYHQSIINNSSHKTQIDISDLSNGIYFWKVINYNQIIGVGKVSLIK